MPHLDELTTAVLSSLLTVALLGGGNWLRVRFGSKCSWMDGSSAKGSDVHHTKLCPCQAKNPTNQVLAMMTGPLSKH
jgi:hypothetical protein